MSGAVESGSTGQPGVTPERTRGQSDERSLCPAGLTEDGLAQYRTLREANERQFRQSLERELTLHWLSLRIDGPEIHTWDRVAAADAARKERERREIIDEARPKIRAELVEELQEADQQNRELLQTVDELQQVVDELQGTLGELQDNAGRDDEPPTSRWILRWPSGSRLRRVGHALIAGSATTLAAAAIPTVNPWEKLALVTASVIGTLLVPSREEP